MVRLLAALCAMFMAAAGHCESIYQPVRYVIEYAGSKNHVCIAPTTGTAPAHMQARPAELTGIPVRRISEISEFPWARKWDGNPALGLTNGYSKFSCVNSSGEYALAYGTQAGISALIRLSDGRFMGWPQIVLIDKRKNGVGDKNAPRWDLSGRPGTEMRLICDGSWDTQDFIVDLDPLKNTQHDMVRGKYMIDMDTHGDQSARWRPFSVPKKRLMLLDLQTKEIIDTGLDSAGHDVSPNGEWLLYTRHLPHRLYRTADLLRQTTDTFVEVPTKSHGHDGWAYDRDGKQVFVAMDNTNDWYFAFDPATKKRTDIVHMGELGWGTNYHLARMINPAKKGWMLMSTYSTEDPAVSWAANQIMMIEIKPAKERPRIWRLGPTYVRFAGKKKSTDYFTEAFASLDPTGDYVYWGSNWMGTDNLELYRMELPKDWEKRLN